ncbi:MAG TPA: 30S ribosomal protein S20 [Candidatus Binatia bacterium]|nr:30S ribosomal protein S20 [Candidatus Binatia bacterium]
MANHPSAEKRHRQSVKRAARNQRVRTRVRSEVKRARTAIEGGDATGASQAVADAARGLDKAVAKGVLHRNNASRRISRLAKSAAKLASG